MLRGINERQKRWSVLEGNIWAIVNDAKKSRSRREDQLVIVGEHILLAIGRSIDRESRDVVHFSSDEQSSPSRNVNITFYDAENLITL